MESLDRGHRFPHFKGASAIDCWWNQNNPMMFNRLLAEMVFAVLKCGKFRISHFVCWR